MAVRKKNEFYRGACYAMDYDGVKVGFSSTREDLYKKLIYTPGLEVFEDKRKGSFSVDGFGGDVSLSYIIDTAPVNDSAAVLRFTKDGEDGLNHYFRNGIYEGTEVFRWNMFPLKGFRIAKSEYLGLAENPFYSRIDRAAKKSPVCGVVMNFTLPEEIVSDLKEAKESYPEIDDLIGYYL